MYIPDAYIPVWVLVAAGALWLLGKWITARNQKEDATIKADYDAGQATLARQSEKWRLEDAYEEGKKDAERKAGLEWAAQHPAAAAELAAITEAVKVVMHGGIAALEAREREEASAQARLRDAGQKKTYKLQNRASPSE